MEIRKRGEKFTNEPIELKRGVKNLPMSQ